MPSDPKTVNKCSIQPGLGHELQVYYANLI